MTERIVQADILRGFAIISMLAANLAGRILEQPHPISLRLYGTFAASTFVLLSGGMIQFTFQTRNPGWNHYFQRSLFILIAGCIVDLFAMHVPLVYFDILGLIGVSIPVTYFTLKLSPILRTLISGLIIFITPVLQSKFGYADVPTEILITANGFIPIHSSSSGILNHWLIDGYFPIFPWIGFSILGTLLMPYMQSYQTYSSERKFILFALSILFLEISILFWMNFPGKLLIRANYSEMFYPPTIGYFFTACGIFLLLYQIISLGSGFFFLKPLRIIGSASLIIYIFHYVFIEYFLVNLSGRMGYANLVPLKFYLLCYAILLGAVFALGSGIHYLKTRENYSRLPGFLKFYFGS